MIINELGMREISAEEARKIGVDLTYVGVCKKLRKLAKLDRLQLDETMHRSNLNLHLFKYIKYCGLSPLEYIKEYLSNLQPYMIERRKDQEKQESFICVVDNMYRISVYIKADNSFGDEMIISFHEDNIRGVAKTNSLIKNTKDRLVPVIADSYGSINRENGNVSVKLFVQRGMKTLPIDVIGFKCKDVFIVREGDIDRQFLDYCNQYIRDLYTSNLKLDFDQVTGVICDIDYEKVIPQKYLPLGFDAKEGNPTWEENRPKIDVTSGEAEKEDSFNDTGIERN